MLGQRIYNMHCYFCHGYAGDARTVASGYLQPPPRDFTTTDPERLSRQQMITAVSAGKKGTAMMSFNSQLDSNEIAAVVDYVRSHFMLGHIDNTRYHTAENGWTDFQRYAAAFPFVAGDIAIDAPDNELTAAQQRGKRLFIKTCLTCHEGRSNEDTPLQLDPRAVSYPRGAYSNKTATVDAVSGATPFAQHEKAPDVAGLTAQQQQGERLFQANCAFCHGADGSGRNWIGSFLEPHPRNLGADGAMQGMTAARLRDVIRNGLPGTTMSAWHSVLSDEEIDAIVAYVMRVFVGAGD